DRLVACSGKQFAGWKGCEREIRRFCGWKPAADRERSTPDARGEVAKTGLIEQGEHLACIGVAEWARRLGIGRWRVDDFGYHFAQARPPWIFGLWTPDREGEPATLSEPTDQVAEGGWRIVIKHHAKARYKPIIGRFLRRRRSHVRDREGDIAIIGTN